MGTAGLLKRVSIRMPGRSPGPIKAALTQQIQAGTHQITAADPLPDDLRDALAKINHAEQSGH